MDDREVDNSAESLKRLRTYHRLVLDFAKGALGPVPIPTLLDRACECAAEGTGVKRAKVLRYRAEGDDLLIITGVGWKPGVVGHQSLPSHRRSPPGLTYRSATPTFIDDLPNNPDFDYSDLLREHGIVSLVNVPITVNDQVWGVLEVDSEQPRRFNADDREFLCGFAEIIGRSIENRQQFEEMRKTGLDHQIALREREALFRELQHRVANQLHMIVGALEVAGHRLADPAARKVLDELSRRAVSIARTHAQLSLARVEQDISLEIFFQRLLPTLPVPEGIEMISSIEDAAVGIGTAVRLGLIVNELVTNSVKHAFAQGEGHITIALHASAEASGGILIVSDDGIGMSTEPQASGAGLGLIRTLVSQIGGSVNWSSGEGRGTSIVVSFPLKT